MKEEKISHTQREKGNKREIKNHKRKRKQFFPKAVKKKKKKIERIMKIFKSEEIFLGTFRGKCKESARDRESVYIW